MRRQVVQTARDDAANFLRRCENALSFGRQYEEPAWKLAGLAEAAEDARAALANYDEVLA